MKHHYLKKDHKYLQIISIFQMMMIPDRLWRKVLMTIRIAMSIVLGIPIFYAGYFLLKYCIKFSSDNFHIVRQTFLFSMQYLEDFFLMPQMNEMAGWATTEASAGYRYNGSWGLLAPAAINSLSSLKRRVAELLQCQPLQSGLQPSEMDLQLPSSLPPLCFAILSHVVPLI